MNSEFDGFFRQYGYGAGGSATEYLNGLGPGTRNWTEPESDSPRVLLRLVNGAMPESIWRAAKSPLDAWPSSDKWMLDIRMIQNVERRGLTGFWWTKTWCDGKTCNADPRGRELAPQWLHFFLASYLLAAESFPEYDLALGTASGEMRQFGETGVYWHEAGSRDGSTYRLAAGGWAVRSNATRLQPPRANSSPA